MVREIGEKLLKKRNYAIAFILDNFKMNVFEGFLCNVNNLMESFSRVGLILISTIDAGIIGLVGRRLFSICQWTNRSTFTHTYYMYQ